MKNAKIIETIKNSPQLRGVIRKREHGARPAAESVSRAARVWERAKARVEREKRVRRNALRCATIAATLLLVLAVATPIERALTLELYHAVAEFTGDSLRFAPKDLERNAVQPYPFVQVEPGSFGSLQEAFEHMGMELFYLGADEADAMMVEVESDSMGLCVWAAYDVDHDGKIDIVFDQTIYPLDTKVGHSFHARNAEFATSTLPNGETVYWILREDGAVIAAAQWENFVMSVASETLTFEQLKGFLDNIN